MDRSPRCDVTGYITEGIGYLEGDHCTELATHRYRSKRAGANDPWGYRCTRDAQYLDRRFVVVEEIGEAS